MEHLVNLMKIFNIFFSGGGVDDELIDVIEMSIDDARNILSSKGPHCCPPSFLFGLSWFMLNKANKIEANSTCE